MNTCALFSQPPQLLGQNAENIYKEFTSIYFSMTTTSKMGQQRLELRSHEQLSRTTSVLSSFSEKDVVWLRKVSQPVPATKLCVEHTSIRFRSSKIIYGQHTFPSTTWQSILQTPKTPRQPTLWMELDDPSLISSFWMESSSVSTKCQGMESENWETDYQTIAAGKYHKLLNYCQDQ